MDVTLPCSHGTVLPLSSLRTQNIKCTSVIQTIRQRATRQLRGTAPRFVHNQHTSKRWQHDPQLKPLVLGKRVLLLRHGQPSRDPIPADDRVPSSAEPAAVIRIRAGRAREAARAVLVCQSEGVAQGHQRLPSRLTHPAILYNENVVSSFLYLSPVTSV